MKGRKINLSNSEWKIVLKCKACMDIDIEYKVDVSPLTLACLNGSSMQLELSINIARISYRMILFLGPLSQSLSV